MLPAIISLCLVSYLEAVYTPGQDPRANCPSQLPRTKTLLVYKNTCLQLVNDTLTWEASRRQCVKRGGDLVIVQDPSKQQFIENALQTLRWKYINYGVWIGATDKATESVWKWIDEVKVLITVINTNLTYDLRKHRETDFCLTGSLYVIPRNDVAWGNWQIGQGPGHASGTGFLFASGLQEDCGIIRISDGFKWHDFPCDLYGYKYTSICEYKMTGTNVETPAPTQPNIETPAPTQPNIETPAPTQPNIETPAPTQPNIETPAPTQPNRETPAPTQPNIETPVPTQLNRETPASTMQVIIG